ncbi:MAG: YebC/PmpR family DNA-binding transcriptional regulator, partial [Treponema sp.]|nr:YebC/PmpR family DNA-binding transcriptional regulator [Treponema sp.]
GVITVTTAPNDFTSVMEALEKKQKPEDDKKKKDDEEDPWKPLSAEVAMVPLSYTDVDMDTAAKVQKLLDKLEEDDDVQNVWSTVNYPDGFEG